MSLKLACKSGCQLTDAKKSAVVQQLRDAHGLSDIPLDKVALLIKMVGSVFSIYPLGGDDISYIHSAEPLTPYFVVDRAKLALATSVRRISPPPLLQLAIFRMPSWIQRSCTASGGAGSLDPSLFGAIGDQERDQDCLLY